MQSTIEESINDAPASGNDFDLIIPESLDALQHIKEQTLTVSPEVGQATEVMLFCVVIGGGILDAFNLLGENERIRKLQSAKAQLRMRHIDSNMLENTLMSIAGHIQSLVQPGDFQGIHQAILNYRSLGEALMGDMEKRLIINPAYKPRVPVSEVLIIPDLQLIKILSHEGISETALSEKLLRMLYIRKGKYLVSETPVSTTRDSKSHAEMRRVAAVHRHLVEANFGALELLSRSKDNLNREIIKLILDYVQKMIAAWWDICNHIKEFDPEPGFNLLSEKQANFRKQLLSYSERQLQSKKVAQEIYSMRPFHTFYDITSLSQFINFIHQNSFEQLRKSLAQINQSATVVRVFGKKLSIINLNAENIIADGEIKSLFLSIFLEAFDEQQAREVETQLIIYDDYLIADTALGLHSANIQARLAAPDEGGMVRVRYQEGFINDGRTWRLLFLSKVLHAYGAHVEIIGKTLLKMQLDKDYGASDLIAIRTKFIQILNLLFYARDLDLHLKSEQHALALAESFLHHARIRHLEHLGIKHIQEPQEISESQRDRLNQRLKQLGIPPLPEHFLVTQTNIDRFVNAEIGRRYRRGELISNVSRTTLSRNLDYHPIQDLVADIEDVERGYWLIRNAELILPRAALIRFNTIGAIGCYLVQIGTFKTRSMTQMVAIILRDPDNRGILLARIVQQSDVTKQVHPRRVKKLIEELVRYSNYPKGESEDYESRMRNYRRRIKRSWPDARAADVVVARGIAVSAGLVKGIVTMKKEPAKKPNQVLLTRYTEPQDTPLMNSFAAIVTTTGGRLSHTAIVAREMGIPSVTLTQAEWVSNGEGIVCRIRLYFPQDFKTTTTGYRVATTISEKYYHIREGDSILVDGTSGEVIFEEVPGALLKVDYQEHPHAPSQPRSSSASSRPPKPRQPKKRSKDLIVPLTEIDQHQTSVAGSKAAHLGELAVLSNRIGFRIATGFVITTTAFERFISATGIEQDLKKLWSREDKPLNWVSAKIKRLFLDAYQRYLPFVVQLKDAVETQARSLHEAASDSPIWAVRSSNVFADTAEASFAGQRDTYLGVSTEDLFESVVHNMISLATPRALNYRTQLAVCREFPIHAVLVQKMIDSDVSGVIFTSNPLQQEQDRMVITAAQGLGEGIVSGIVPADEYTVDKTTLNEVQEPILGRQNIKVALAEDRGTKIVPMIHRNTQPVLFHSDIYRLAQIAMAIESHFQEPQDIEWGIKVRNHGERAIYVYQARPITARIRSPS